MSKRGHEHDHRVLTIVLCSAILLLGLIMSVERVFVISDDPFSLDDLTGYSVFEICRDMFTSSDDGGGLTVDWDADPGDCASCTEQGACVVNGLCISGGAAKTLAGYSGNDKTVMCGSVNRWYDVDGGQIYCEDYQVNFHWSKAGESGVGEYGAYSDGGYEVFDGFECCGDDEDEYYIDLFGNSACCNDLDDCVDAEGNCLSGVSCPDYECTVEEATQSCTADNTCDGEQTCSAGFWGDCVAVENFCDIGCNGTWACTLVECAVCTCSEGDNKSCMPTDGCEGIQYCDAKGDWGDCVSAQYYCDSDCDGDLECSDTNCSACSCTTGQTKNCSTNSSCGGEQTCTAGDWGGCVASGYFCDSDCDGDLECSDTDCSSCADDYDEDCGSVIDNHIDDDRDDLTENETETENCFKAKLSSCSEGILKVTNEDDDSVKVYVVLDEDDDMCEIEYYVEEFDNETNETIKTINSTICEIPEDLIGLYEENEDSESWYLEILSILEDEDEEITYENESFEIDCQGSDCQEDWNCTEFSICLSSGLKYRECEDENECGTYDLKPNETMNCSRNDTCSVNWTCGNWTECAMDGFQTRTCTDEGDCDLAVSDKPVERQACNYTPVCDDGVMNGDEEDVDCGGTCEKECIPPKPEYGVEITANNIYAEVFDDHFLTVEVENTGEKDLSDLRIAADKWANDPVFIQSLSVGLSDRIELPVLMPGSPDDDSVEIQAIHDDNVIGMKIISAELTVPELKMKFSEAEESGSIHYVFIMDDRVSSGRKILVDISLSKDKETIYADTFEFEDPEGSKVYYETDMLPLKNLASGDYELEATFYENGDKINTETTHLTIGGDRKVFNMSFLFYLLLIAIVCATGYVFFMAYGKQRS